MGNKKVPLSKEEFIALANDLNQSATIMSKWLDRFYKAYAVNGRECKELYKVLNLLTCLMSHSQEIHWNRITGRENGPSPFYGWDVRLTHQKPAGYM